MKGLLNANLTLIKVKCGEEDDILDCLANLDVRWLDGEIANEWKVTQEEVDDDEYYLVIFDGKELSWERVDEVDDEEWKLFVNENNVGSEERLEAEEFIEIFMR